MPCSAEKKMILTALLECFHLETILTCNFQIIEYSLAY